MFQVNAQRPGHHQEVNEVDDKATATQLVKTMNTEGCNVSRTKIIKGWRILRWTIHGELG